MPEQLTLDLFVPDRFEPLRERAEQQLGTIVVPVDEALSAVDELHQDMRSAGRGALLVLRGDSGTGKSTFLHTVPLFREGVESFSISASDDVREALGKLKPYQGRLRILVLEEREALKDMETEEIERDLHAINGYLRSTAGRNSMIVWPCNTDGMQARLVSTARTIGATALLGNGEQAFQFQGPSRHQFRPIAENTVATLNQGATLTDLGISDDELGEMVEHSETVGKLLGMLRGAINKKQGSVITLIKKEQCKLWIVVAAGNEPDGDVAALTRGRYSAIDIERMLSSTEANIVKELKAYPEKLGILATVLDAKIFHLPMLAALDIARSFPNPDLRNRMRKAALAEATTTTTKPLDRLNKTELAHMLRAGKRPALTPGKGRAGSNTQESFRKLTEIAQKDDASLNRSIGEALVKAGLITSFEVEKDFGSGLSRRTDLYCETSSGIVRVEMMWRAKVGRADIANYALTKLYNYGRAIGYLPDKVSLSA